MQRVYKYKCTQLARIVATLIRFGSRKIIFPPLFVYISKSLENFSLIAVDLSQVY